MQDVLDQLGLGLLANVTRTTLRRAAAARGDWPGAGLQPAGDFADEPLSNLDAKLREEPACSCAS